MLSRFSRAGSRASRIAASGRTGALSTAQQKSLLTSSLGLSRFDPQDGEAIGLDGARSRRFGGASALSTAQQRSSDPSGLDPKDDKATEQDLIDKNTADKIMSEFTSSDQLPDQSRDIPENHVGIIGFGPRGSYVFNSIVQAQKEKLESGKTLTPIRITIFDPKPFEEGGRGLAWNPFQGDVAEGSGGIVNTPPEDSIKAPAKKIIYGLNQKIMKNKSAAPLVRAVAMAGNQSMDDDGKPGKRAKTAALTTRVVQGAFHARLMEGSMKLVETGLLNITVDSQQGTAVDLRKTEAGYTVGYQDTAFS